MLVIKLLNLLKNQTRIDAGLNPVIKTPASQTNLRKEADLVAQNRQVEVLGVLVAQKNQSNKINAVVDLQNPQCQGHTHLQETALTADTENLTKDTTGSVEIGLTAARRGCSRDLTLELTKNDLR